MHQTCNLDNTVGAEHRAIASPERQADLTSFAMSQNDNQDMTYRPVIRSLRYCQKEV